MPLYISNTNRVESLQGAGTRGTNSTTTTTLVPPEYGWGFAYTGPGLGPDTNYEIDYVYEGNPDSSIYLASQSLFPYGILRDYNTNISIYPTGAVWESAMGSDFQVKPDIFGKVATFENTTYSYMLASYIPYSSSRMIYEMVPPTSSIQRCVTYPAYTFFNNPLTGSGDNTWKIPVGPEVFGADCQYDVDPECYLVYNDYSQGASALFTGSAPCDSGSI